MKRVLLIALCLSVVASFAFGAQQLIDTPAGVMTEQDKTSINENFTEVYSDTSRIEGFVGDFHYCADVLDETTALSVATLKTFRAPVAFTITAVRASVTTAPAGADLTVNITNDGTTIFDTTELTIDDGDTTSVGSAADYVLDDTNVAVADNNVFTIAPTQIGSGTEGAGLKVCIYGTRTVESTE